MRLPPALRGLGSVPVGVLLAAKKNAEAGSSKFLALGAREKDDGPSARLPCRVREGSHAAQKSVVIGRCSSLRRRRSVFLAALCEGHRRCHAGLGKLRFVVSSSLVLGWITPVPGQRFVAPGRADAAEADDGDLGRGSGRAVGRHVRRALAAHRGQRRCRPGLRRGAFPQRNVRRRRSTAPSSRPMRATAASGSPSEALVPRRLRMSRELWRTCCVIPGSPASSGTCGRCRRIR